MLPFVAIDLCIKAKPWFVAYGCFIENIELGSHFSIKAKNFWLEGDRFRQVLLYLFDALFLI